MMDRSKPKAVATRWHGFVASLAILLATSAPTHSIAQNIGGIGPAVDTAHDLDATEIVLATPDNDLVRPVKAAQRLLAQERFLEAIELLDRALGRTLGDDAQDFFVPMQDKPNSHRSLRREITALIGGLPSKARDAYETKFGTLAQRQLLDATRQGDLAKMAAIARRYYHTRAGYRASLLVARRLIGDGDPAAAVLVIERLRSHDRARQQLEPHLTSLLAVAHARAGRTPMAKTLIAKVKETSPSIEIAGSRVSDSTWLESIPVDDAGAAGNDEQWRMFRGNATRTATANGGTPLLSRRWHLDTSGHPSVGEFVAERNRAYLDAEVPTLPAMHPLVVGDTVLLRTLRQLIAVDIRTGRRMWYSQPLVDDRFDETITRDGPLSTGILNSQAGLTLEQRVWDDLALGTMSSDGKRVYVVEGPSLAAEIRRDEFVDPFDDATGSVWSRSRITNRLAAYRIDSQGKLAWRVGGAASSVAPELAGAFFLGPPLPVGDCLYCLIEARDEIKLVALNPDRGTVVWSQQIAIVERNIAHPQERLRRLVGATPSYHAGVLVCPTSAGAVVAVDTIDRSLLWARRYRREEYIVASRADMLANGDTVEHATRWTDASATIVQDRVLVTPVATNHLYCFRLSDGKLLWKRPRGDGLYVACVHHDNAIIVGSKSVSSVRLADGTSAWKQSDEDSEAFAGKDSPSEIESGSLHLPENSMPSGRGFASGGHYYLPLSTAEIAKIRLADGTLVSRARSQSRRLPGNLVCAAGMVVSQSFGSLEAYEQRETLIARAQKLLIRNANNASALATLGEVQLADGDYVRAFGSLRRSFLEKPSLRTRVQLTKSLLAAMRENFTAVTEQARSLEYLLENDSEREAFLRANAEGLHKSGAIEQAFQAYVAVYKLPDADGKLTRTGEDLSVERHRWLSPRFRTLRRQATPEQRRKIDDAVVRLWKDIEHSDSADRLRGFATAFASLPVSDEAHWALAENLATKRHPAARLERENILRDLSSSGNRDRAAMATADLAVLMESQEKQVEAARLYGLLGAKFANVQCGTRGTGSELAEAWTIRTAKSDQGGTAIWPSGLVTARVTRRRPTDDYPSTGDGRFGEPPEMALFDLPLARRTETVFRNSRFVIDPNDQDLIIRDSLGQKRLQVSLGEPSRWGGLQLAPTWSTASALGHLLMVTCGDTLYAIDTLRVRQGARDRILWQQTLSVQIPGMIGHDNDIDIESADTAIGTKRFSATDRLGRPIGKPGAVTRSGIVYQRARRLYCANPYTGQAYWVRENVPAGCHIWADADYVIAVPPHEDNSTEYFVLRGDDGELLAKRTLPPLKNQIAAVGRNLATWSSVPAGDVKDAGDELKERTRLTIHDLSTGATRYFEYPAGSFAYAIDDLAIAVLTRDGHLSIRALPSGNTLFTHALPKLANLTGIRVVDFGPQILLLLERPAPPIPAGTRYTGPIALDFISDVPQSAGGLASGLLYALDRDSGKTIWKAPVEFQHFAPLVWQPDEIPVTVLARRKIKARKDGSHVTGACLLCLDRRSGQVVYRTNSLADDFSTLDVFASDDRSSITINVGMSKVRLTFTDQPVPPAPPAQLGDRPHRRRLGNETRVFSSLWRAFSGTNDQKNLAEQRKKFLEED
ncbi:MAG: PQQ-binding-like beta-propeller repeat protein [Pirellulales bacterium]|nr:PQQ-binding-like beta-propeller repeat protein [Pirellulales bacterium]